MNSKSSIFLAALKSYLADTFLDNGVDAVIVTPRTFEQAIDAGIVKSESPEVGRVTRALLIRRAFEDPAEPRAGNRIRLTSIGSFQIAILVSAEYAAETDLQGVAEDEVLTYALYDLSDELQDAIEAMPPAAGGAFAADIIGTSDFADPTSQFFGSILTIGARFLRVG